MIEKKLNYNFKDPQLLKTALTHSSYANETSVESNERMEFLGDAVLGFIVARVLYDLFPDASEGKLSKMRSAIVSRMNFAHFAKGLKIDKQMLLGKGEENTGGRKRQSNLAGAFEAVIGAIFIDGGYKKVYGIVTKLLKNCLNGDEEIFRDYKTRLQEVAQRQEGGVGLRQCHPVADRSPGVEQGDYVGVLDPGTDLLMKPFSVEQLATKVAAVLRRRAG